MKHPTQKKNKQKKNKLEARDMFILMYDTSKSLDFIILLIFIP